MDKTWEYIDRSQIHVGIGTEAAQFLFWEYMNPNFFAMGLLNPMPDLDTAKYWRRTKIVL